MILWPATFAGHKMEDVQSLIRAELQVQQQVLLPSLHYPDLRRLVVETYNGEPFIGSAEDGYRTSTDKSKWVWRESDRSAVMLVRSRNESILEVKEAVRKLCGIGRHAIHTTDTTSEASHVWSAANRLFFTGYRHDEDIRLR